ncbi:MAG: acyl carrier protein [Oscillospiraceae bacterium]|nr:acyl carrier protein [Oscillospiraceae bacterium]
MVFEKVRAILAELLSIDENTITMDSLIIDNLGADSLDLVDAVVTLNDEFGVEVPDDEIENLRSVGDVVRYIEANMK